MKQLIGTWTMTGIICIMAAGTAMAGTNDPVIEQREVRMKSDGKLTAAERRKLDRQQNRASRNIYRKKHNLRQVNVQ